MWVICEEDHSRGACVSMYAKEASFKYSNQSFNMLEEFDEKIERLTGRMKENG